MDDVTWLIKADLSSGYRQFGTHPVDWRFQVYCNGPNEHYIDLACPFGKTNSSLEFCAPIELLAKSMAIRYSQIFDTDAPVLGTHVDDIFGGFKNCASFDKAMHFREFLFKMGSELTIQFNPKLKKTPLPAKSQVILGRLYNSVTTRVNTAPNKVRKYRLRLAAILAVRITTKKELERLHGCLNYVADVEPFGRPFLALLTSAIVDARDHDRITLSPLARKGLQIWDLILKKNKGISMDFLLDRLPAAQSNIFVDASSS